MSKLAIFPVGGESQRMEADIPKWMLPVPNSTLHKKTIVQLTVDPYIAADWEILFLARHLDIPAARILMEMYDANLMMDPVAKIGRGGALKNAWSKIQGYDVVIIHNPDDVVLNNITPTTPWEVMFKDQAVVRTVDSIPHPYTTFDMNRYGEVKRVMRKSRIWQPAHIGITILCGSALQYIPQLPDTPCDFEAEAFPKMKRVGQLFAHPLQASEDWYACNDKKTYELLCKTLEEEIEEDEE